MLNNQWTDIILIWGAWVWLRAFAREIKRASKDTDSLAHTGLVNTQGARDYVHSCTRRARERKSLATARATIICPILMEDEMRSFSSGH